MDVSFFRAAKDVFLEAEANPSSASRFERKYQDVAGSAPVRGDGYQHQRNKWGTEVRVYFNCDSDLSTDFSNEDVYVERGRRPYRKQWRYRTNDREFFWALVNAGYRLGAN